MNDQNSKKILYNKSTLISLKAELLRKQEEVYEKKQLSQNKIENFKPPKSSDNNFKSKPNDKKRSFKDNLKEVDTEELEACRKSKAILEKKAELYEHLSDKTGSSQLAGQFLVDFETKKQQEPEKHLSPEKEHLDEHCDGDEWTEFTDCLGRTRKCLKSDLDLYLKRDEDLKGIKNKGSEETKAEDSTKTEKPFLVQKTHDYLQSLREKWEQKEKELLAKDKDIHYQDLLFDEARIHGVGYYSFSTDETERRKQMEELIRQRQETLKAQKETEELRKKRDELMAARVAAARARQRVRAGLPPEETKANEKDFTTCLLEFLTQQKNEADAKAKEQEKKMKEEQEKERQKLRDAYVREWDIGKEGVDDKVKRFKEMSQEEYVEQQRAKRIDEFAPYENNLRDNSDNTFDNKGNLVSKVNKTWTDVRPIPDSSVPPDIDYVTEKGLYFTTSKKPRNMKYKNFTKAESTPIINEVSDDDNCDIDKMIDGDSGMRKAELTHAEIAPPPTYEYYGPVSKQSRTQKPFESDIREAYAQGTESLKSKSSKRKLPQQYDFTFD